MTIEEAVDQFMAYKYPRLLTKVVELDLLNKQAYEENKKIICDWHSDLAVNKSAIREKECHT